MFRIKIVRVSKGRAGWADAAVQEYAKRLARQGSYDEDSVKPVSFKGDVDAVRKAEGERLLKRVKPSDVVIAVDERGDAPDSHGFADRLQAWNLEGRVVFLLGGAYGLDASVRKRATSVVRLSNLVMNHEVARIALHEQIYRATTLLNGTPYHH